MEVNVDIWMTSGDCKPIQRPNHFNSQLKIIAK